MNSGLSTIGTRLRNTGEAFRTYALPHNQGPVDTTRLLFEEAHVRFRQLAWIVDRIRALEAELEALEPATCSRDEVLRKAADRRMFGVFDEAGFYTEAFYLFAWRTRGILRRLPGLNAFDPRGVRQVRNQLIEHPEQRGGVLSRSLGLGNEQLGPQLKGGRQPDAGEMHEVQDEGLVANVEEFCDELLRRISNATTSS